jgi:hypothetical protein
LPSNSPVSAARRSALSIFIFGVAVFAFVWSRNRSDPDPRTADVEAAPHAAPIVHGATIGSSMR